jgi:hypothetical protein
MRFCAAETFYMPLTCWNTVAQKLMFLSRTIVPSGLGQPRISVGLPSWQSRLRRPAQSLEHPPLNPVAGVDVGSVEIAS